MGGPEWNGAGSAEPEPMRVLVVGGAVSACLLREAGLEVLIGAAGPQDAAGPLAGESAQVVVVELGEGPGARTAAVVEALSVHAPVLVLADDGHAGVLAAVRAGAAGYLAPTHDAAELADAVRRTAAGEAVFSPGLAAVVLEEYGRVGAGTAPDVTPRLTEREADVLRLVVEGLTARQIAGRLVLSPRTVENHIQRTLRKFHLQGRAALVRYAIERGLA